MSVMLVNGSPRGEQSNSNLIGQWYGNGCPVDTTVYLSKVKHFDDYIQASKAYERFVFIFPLYVDGMPGQVKSYFEGMAMNKDIFEGREVLFVIHSGFSEGIHCKNLEKYLYRFTEIMGMKNKGVVIIPGSEGFKVMPPNMTEKKAKIVEEIGRDFDSGKDLDSDKYMKLFKRLKFSKPMVLLLIIMGKMGLMNFYWNSQLKSNNAFEKRFDAPFS